MLSYWSAHNWHFWDDTVINLFDSITSWQVHDSEHIDRPDVGDMDIELAVFGQVKVNFVNLRTHIITVKHKKTNYHIYADED